MPWTFAHPAVALLGSTHWRRFPERGLAFGLGCLMPDAGYYMGRFGRWLGGEIGSHSLFGSALMGLLFGGALLAFLRRFGVDLAAPLPAPHAALIAQYFEGISQRRWTMSTIAGVAGALVLGAWSHVWWDSFTHRTGAMVPIFGLQSVYGYLQHASTIIGTWLLAWAYGKKLRDETTGQRGGDWRLVLLTLLGSICFGAWHTAQVVQNLPLKHWWRAVHFEFAIASTLAVVVIWLITALFARGRMNTRAPKKPSVF